MNKCTASINKSGLTVDELVVSLAQLLIRTGKSIYDPEEKLPINEIDWVALNREYYLSKESNIGLGLMLNGGQMMGAIDQTKLIINTKNEETEDGKVPPSIKGPQEISRDATQSTTPTRRRRKRSSEN